MLGTPLASSANPISTVDQVAKANLTQASTQAVTSQSAPVNVVTHQQPSQAVIQTSKAIAFNETPTPDLKLTHAVVKLGEQPQVPTAAKTEHETIAKVQAHNLAGRRVATLYVRNIPILTFTNSSKTPATTGKAPVKLESRQLTALGNTIVTANLDNASSSGDFPVATAERAPSPIKAVQADPSLSQSDPVLRAAAIAAKINQLNQVGVDAKTITVSWNAQASKATATGEQYAIKANKTLIAVIDASTVLPDTTHNLEKDALQATNRLRRLLGNASPLANISGKPNTSQVAVGSIRLKLSGMASWYGPGFNGSPSASGEPFNQNAMTAAHRTLPFGTQVLVTNLDNGQSVVVRINDRGPYAGDRVIDLSAAAARVLGLIQSGVAPVRLDVLENRPSTITASGD